MSWRIAIASLDGVSISEHFGRAKYFYVVDVREDGTGKLVEKRDVKPLCGNGEHSDDGLASAVGALGDCTAVLAARIGPSARRALELARISVFEQADYIDDSVKKLAAYFAKTNRPATGEK